MRKPKKKVQQLVLNSQNVSYVYQSGCTNICWQLEFFIFSIHLGLKPQSWVLHCALSFILSGPCAVLKHIYLIKQILSRRMSVIWRQDYCNKYLFPAVFCQPDLDNISFSTLFFKYAWSKTLDGILCLLRYVSTFSIESQLYTLNVSLLNIKTVWTTVLMFFIKFYSYS